VKWTRFKAKLDTGAHYSRIGAKEAAALKLGPIIKVLKINTGSGSETRVVVPAEVRIGGLKINNVNFTVTTRRDGVLIGLRTIGKRFEISPSKKYLGG
jgi:hypothetical protein